MNPKTLVHFSAAERQLVEAILCQEEINQLRELAELAEACCDLYEFTFNGEVAEA